MLFTNKCYQIPDLLALFWIVLVPLHEDDQRYIHNAPSNPKICEFQRPLLRFLPCVLRCDGHHIRYCWSILCNVIETYCRPMCPSAKCSNLFSLCLHVAFIHGNIDLISKVYFKRTISNNQAYGIVLVFFGVGMIGLSNIREHPEIRTISLDQQRHQILSQATLFAQRHKWESH